jgi:type IV secretory pathway TraG/TraD family ATPase VirD4
MGRGQPLKDSGVYDGFIFFILLIFIVRAGALQFSLKLSQLQNYLSMHPTLLSLGVCLLGLSATSLIAAHFWNLSLKRLSANSILNKDESSIILGTDVESKKLIHLKEEFRTAHTQVIGSTNAGKTASIILPWAVQDIEKGRGLIIIDGKADQSFLYKIYSYAVRSNRQRDFKVFSLANPAISSTYNPFCEGTAEQITERFFSTLEMSDPYYESIQFAALRTILSLLIRRGEKPLPGVIRELLRDKERLKGWLSGLNDANLVREIQAMLQDSQEDFQKKYSGLVTALGHFSYGATSSLYNTRYPEIDILEVIKRKQICYFQLPTMQFPFLGEATGKLVLQSLQSAVSEIQVNSRPSSSLFSVYLDDFNDYIYPAFASLLNKSRSANVGVVFSHQSLGDLEKVGPDFKQIVLTNTNIKVIMRSNDPDSAEHFASLIGTKTGDKTTQRRSLTL